MNKIEIKKISLKNLIPLLIAGLLLLICTLPAQSGNNSAGNKTNSVVSEQSLTPTPVPTEARLKEILSRVEGVGKVEVMIQYRNSAEAIPIEGVVVVADGATSVKVVQYILDATEALFGIPKHKIIVLPMQRKDGSS